MKRLLFVCVFAGGCGASLEQLQSRVAFEMNCPKEQITVVEIDDRTRGVTGCGKKAVYVESCRTNKDGLPLSCTWTLDSQCADPNTAHEQPARTAAATRRTSR